VFEREAPFELRLYDDASLPGQIEIQPVGTLDLFKVRASIF
jgi:hypothetical protein